MKLNIISALLPFDCIRSLLSAASEGDERQAHDCQAPLDLVKPVLEDVRMQNNTVPVNSTAPLGCPHLGSALAYLVSYMDVEEIDIVAPSISLSKRACTPTKAETCAAVPTLGNECPASEKVCVQTFRCDVA